MTEEVLEAPVVEDKAATTTTPATTPDTPAEPAAEAPVTPKWSTTWREDMAGTLAENATPEDKAEHDKLVKRLSRFNTPADAAKAIREHDRLISSGALKKPLPKNPTEADLAAYRREHGIPEAADKYDLGIAKNVALSDLDNEMLTDWAAKAHAVHAPPEVVKAGAAAYLEMRDRVAAQVEERNAEAKTATTEELRADWGPDYAANVGGVSGLLKNSDSQAVNDLLAARTEDGVQLLNNPAVMRWLAGHARALGYVGATITPQGGDLGKTVDDEIDSLRAQMGTPEWATNSKAHARYLQLMEQKQRLDARK